MASRIFMREIWLRHRNGGGKVYGNDAEVSDDSYLDRHSSVGDLVEVFSARIYGSTLSDNVRVCGYPEPIEIVACELSKNTRLWQRPLLRDVSLANVSIFGDARLYGPWDLRDYVRIHAGTWMAPPRYHVIAGNGIKVTISECTEDRFHLACWCMSYDAWTRKGYRQRLGGHAGWTPGQIQLAFEKFTEWRK